MMKKLIVVVLSVFITFPAFSQISFGIKAGVSTTNLKMDDFKTLISGSTQYTVDALKGANYGFHAGAFVRISMMGVYVEPELLFSSRTDEYKVTDITNPSSPVETISKQKFDRLDLPVMVGLRLGPIRLDAGPSARLLINSPKDLISNADYKAMYHNLTFGYQAGLGVDLLKRITLDLRYEGSLQKYQTQIENLTGDKINLDDRPNAFLLTVGVFF